MTNNLNMATRGEKRSDCVIMATISFGQQKALGRVVNLSATGMAIELREQIILRAGDTVMTASSELGHIQGTVRWLEGFRIGLEFRLNTNALAQVSSYFRFFHQETKPRRA